ncbi:dynein axonemal light chain 4 [Colias croceus]|uniref:dynein axonemal light chain 4 n=1 Tax=Colias crocea TaxID=72248 RepID=UPI001E27E673|nr:dynein axonemal light chain 4 [Colias croceus]
MAEEGAAATGGAAAGEKVIHTYPLIRHSDMSEEMRTEAMELSVTACEKFSQNNELAARMVKESMDKKFGPAFHVVVGESYGFEITYECTTICYMYFGGNQAICIWKCS